MIFSRSAMLRASAALAMAFTVVAHSDQASAQMPIPRMSAATFSAALAQLLQLGVAWSFRGGGGGPR